MEWHLRLALPCHGTRASRAMSSISTPFSRMLQFTGRGGRQVDSRVCLQIAPLQGSNRIGNVEGGRAALRGTQTTRAHAIRRCGRLPGSAGREQTTRAISASSCQNPTVLRSRPHPIDHLDLFLITISGLFLFYKNIYPSIGQFCPVMPFPGPHRVGLAFSAPILAVRPASRHVGCAPSLAAVTISLSPPADRRRRCVHQLNAFDKIRSAFLWNGSADVHGGKCLVAWDRIKSPKPRGGLCRNIG